MHINMQSHIQGFFKKGGGWGPLGINIKIKYKYMLCNCFFLSPFSFLFLIFYIQQRGVQPPSGSINVFANICGNVYFINTYMQSCYSLIQFFSLMTKYIAHHKKCSIQHIQTVRKLNRFKLMLWRRSRPMYSILPKNYILSKNLDRALESPYPTVISIFNYSNTFIPPNCLSKK